MLAVLCLAAVGASAAAEHERKLKPRIGEVIYVIKASNAYLPREIQGEVRETLHGVPAAPVDAFTWDGEGMEAVGGSAYVELDPVYDRGYIEVTWTDRYGEWRLVQTDFSIAPLPLGVRLGPGIGQRNTVEDDPVASRLYMHGDSGGVDATLPLLFATIGTWGISRVTLNGEPFENTYDGPTPNWITHSMLVSGVYDETGRVRAGEAVYTPSKADQGLTHWDDYEYQLIFLDHPGPEVEGNLPPVASFAYHLVFEDVEVRIVAKGR